MLLRQGLQSNSATRYQGVSRPLGPRRTSLSVQAYRTANTNSFTTGNSKADARMGGPRSYSSDGDDSQLQKTIQTALSGPRQPQKQAGGMDTLFCKLQLCFEIFFPQKTKELSPKDEVKRRLRMVLVADRCGMSPGGMQDLKKTVAKALQDFVDIDSEDSIQVEVTADPTLGTVYAVRVPVRRVKPEVRFGAEGEDLLQHHDPDAGVTVEWDPTDFHSNPVNRFPMGC